MTPVTLHTYSGPYDSDQRDTGAGTDAITQGQRSVFHVRARSQDALVGRTGRMRGPRLLLCHVQAAPTDVFGWRRHARVGIPRLGHQREGRPRLDEAVRVVRESAREDVRRSPRLMACSG